MVRHTDPEDTNRETIDTAAVSLYAEPDHYDEGWVNYMVVPTADDVSVFDLGDLVTDRIEANGKVTIPDTDDRPDEGETQDLGVVGWDSNGIPVWLRRTNGDVVHFTADGGFDRVETED